MTLITVAPFVFAPYGVIGGGASYASLLIDASGERVAAIVQIPKTGNISHIRFRLATVTTGQTLRVGMYTVDGSGNATTTAYGGMASGTVAVANADDNVTKLVTLSTPAAAVAGDVVAVVIEFDGTVGNLNLGALSLAGKDFPYGAHFTSSWANTTNIPAITLRYDDGTHPVITGVLPAAETVATVSINLNSATQDEIGNVFTAPAAVRVCGVALPFSNAAGGDFEATAYDGTTRLTGVLKSWDGDHAHSVAGSALYLVLFATPFVMAAGEVRRITIRPTTTAAMAVGHFGYGSASERAAYTPDLYRTRRLDEGAWTDDDTSATALWPIVDQIDDGASGGRGGFGQMVSGVTSR